MGRHSSPQQGPFYRSVLAWFMPWLLISVVVGVAVWILVNALGGEEMARSATESSPTPTVEASPKPTKKSQRPDKPKRTKEPGPPPLIIEAVNIQVLNATSDTSVDDRVAGRLEALGFRIEALDEAQGSYPRTTVFWSYPEAQEAAERLAAHFGWLAEAKPENLSTTVAVHVVVGEDEV